MVEGGENQGTGVSAAVQNTRRGALQTMQGGGSNTPRPASASSTASVAAEGRIAQFRRYLGEVRAELNKVVWPTRKETTTTTLVVFLMVVVVSLFLWLVDSILALLVQAVIG